MIKKQFYTVQITKITKDLDFLFNNNTLTTAIKADNELKKAVQTAISILDTFEKIAKSKNKHADLFFKQYKSLLNDDFEMQEIKNNEEYEYLDQINWLTVLCNNKYSIVLQSKKSASSSNSLVATNSNPDEIKRESIITSMLGDNEQTPLNVMEVGEKMQAISKRFYEDVQSGKIFIFTSKPKIIPIIKIIFMICIGIFSLLTIALSIIYFAISNNTLDGFVWLIVGLGTGAVTYKECRMWQKHSKSDNIRFFFNYTSIMLLLVVIGLVIISFTLTFNKGTWTYFQTLYTTANSRTGALKNFTFACIYVQAFVLVVFILLITCVILASIFNPKKDTKKIQSIFNEYIESEKAAAV
ncbi:MAG: hypothetical protein Ta2E_07580 [Mycoplasmoidaceae bacterium]|nr:MAG: hypothetical protein Ta2E_07580 [Mycoplasmoidaceae bacterium]